MQTVKIQNKPELFALVDDEDFERVSRHKWYISPLGYVYARITENRVRKNHFLHRFVMRAPKGKELDHINRKKLDCRKSNLRYCTRSQNCQNRPVRRDNKTGYSGICHTKDGRYQVYCSVNGKHIHRTKDTLPEAVEFRNKLLEEMHGEFIPR